MTSAASDEKVGRTLFTRAQIQRRVAQIARQIRRCYGDHEITILAVMTGSLIFLADLMRRLPQQVRVVLVAASSYPGKCTRPRGPVICGEVKGVLKGKNVLIVDDILDTGNTMAALTKTVRKASAASVKSCVLLRKCRATPPAVEADFVGFHVDDEFVIGYGLDYDDLYRNLPDVRVLKIRKSKESR